MIGKKRPRQSQEERRDTYKQLHDVYNSEVRDDCSKGVEDRDGWMFTAQDTTINTTETPHLHLHCFTSGRTCLPKIPLLTIMTRSERTMHCGAQGMLQYICNEVRNASLELEKDLNANAAFRIGSVNKCILGTGKLMT